VQRAPSGSGAVRLVVAPARPYLSVVSEKHTLRNGIIAGTAATVLGGLLLAPVDGFLGSVWRLVTAAPAAVWGVLTASVPVWALLAVAAVVARRTGRRAAPTAPRPKVYDTATRMVKDPEPPAPSRLKTSRRR